MRNWPLPLLVATVMFGASAAPSAAETQIERGKYLVTITGSGTCHTPGDLLGKPDLTRILAGSEVGFGIPGVGVFVGGNLTPNKETGLGAWTTEQIIAAITTGAMPDGRKLFPVMPWPDLAHLTSDDRPGDRRIPEEPSAGQKCGSGTVRTQGRSAGVCLGRHSWRRLRQDAGAEVSSRALESAT